MPQYQKINTVFKRDTTSNCIMPEFVTDELKMFHSIGMKFEATEKIDGTNMRIELSYSYAGGGWDVSYWGKTDNANIPPFLLEKMQDLFDNVNWTEAFPAAEEGTKITIYGEGYGAKIQKGGGRYISNGVDFILFDVKVGNFWLTRESCEDIAGKLGVKIVPYVGDFTIAEAIDYVQKGFVSNISEDRTYPAEGLVLRAPFGLRLRNGERIIYKVKTCDFEKYRAKYGTDFII